MLSSNFGLHIVNLSVLFIESESIMAKNQKRDSVPDEDGFKKSSWSLINPASRFCVAVKQANEGVQVRDTKDQSKTTLSFSKGEWDAFVKGVKAGEFD